MFSYCKRRFLEIEDWLRYHPRARSWLCHWKSWRGGSVADLCAAARLADDPEVERELQQQIVGAVEQIDIKAVDWTEFVPDFRDGQIHKAAILKPYIAPHERGVVFISFESQWAKLLAMRDVREFADRYTVVISPSSSPHNFINYVFPRAWPAPIFTLISNAHDLNVLPHVSDRFVVVPLYASHWVNPDLYEPTPRSARQYDLIMVASWSKVKRHHVLFSALRSMPKDLRVLLVGQDQDDRTADTIRELASWHGVEDRLTILTNQPYREIPKLFGQARASVVFSKREGSCVVVAESLFADTPAALLNDAVIGSRVFLNEQTGRLLDEGELARDLTALIRDADSFQARGWAEANISCYQSTQVLNDILRSHAVSQGSTWTVDLVPQQWSPDPMLARAEDRRQLANERQTVLKQFGLEIGPPTATTQA